MGPRRKPQLWEVAYKFSQAWVGAILGVPACLLTLVLDTRGAFVDSDRNIIFLGLCYFAWVVIPAAACLSAAMCACPPTEAASASLAMKAVRTIFGIWAFFLFFMAAIELGLAWQYKSIVGAIPHRDVASLAVLGGALPILAAGCWTGFLLGAAARRDRGKPTGRFLGRCWNFTGTDAGASQVENAKTN